MKRNHADYEPANYESALHELAQEALTKNRWLQARLIEQLRRSWREQMGEKFDVALISREAAHQLIFESDPNIQAGALSVIAQVWGSDPAHEDTYRRMAANEDFEIAAAAVACLISLYRNTKDRNISVMFAEFAKDITNSAPLRAIAYMGVFQVCGIEISHQVMLELAQAIDELPKDLDWSIVDSVLAGWTR